MFTGIIETLGELKHIEQEGSNVHFTLASTLSNELKIDQSVAHDGVCLTVVAQEKQTHTVTAIRETLERSALGNWAIGDAINLERAMKNQARLDGHIVQGHVDNTAICIAVESAAGSWYYRFRYQPSLDHILVDKGSICINGVSLTLVEPKNDQFSVAIIPYTYEHTNFKQLKAGDIVNIEFDIIGKYIAKYLSVYQHHLK